MRLGAPVFGNFSTPDEWANAARRAGYSAVYCPVDHRADEQTIRAYADAARRADLVIAEVGAWSNPLSPDERTRREAIEYCQKQLALADQIGALCCVNIAGSRGEPWDGHHPDNLTEETFDLIVETVRAIIDAVKPTRTFYTLETMPWMYPDSVESYVRLICAIDRPAFAVHLDPVNLICSPQRYYGNAELLRECFRKLGAYIKSCHAKDIILHQRLTTHLDECAPGKGGLDYRTYLQELDKLPPDTPLMIEHLATEGEYVEAAQYIRTIAREIGVTIR